jgi:hypothetical protein
LPPEARFRTLCDSIEGGAHMAGLLPQSPQSNRIGRGASGATAAADGQAAHGARCTGPVLRHRRRPHTGASPSPSIHQ